MKTDVARLARHLLRGLAMAMVAIPAQAQIAKPSYLSASKSEAILGGAPSALEAIRAQQSGAVTTGLARAVAPASAGSYFRRAVMPVVRPAVSSERPDVFNSVALTIDRSPLHARWSRVESGGVGGTAAAYAASLRDQDVASRIEAVNSYVNDRVRFVDDRVQFGVTDRWLAASETLSRGRGDCEDYAIAKRAMLRIAGVADKDLYLVVLKDLTRRADHAVLVVRANGRFLVLDNGTDRIVDSSNISDYRPMLTFTGSRAYTHGYRRDLPPITYASNQVDAPVVLASASYEPAFGELETPAVVRESASLIPATITL